MVVSYSTDQVFAAESGEDMARHQIRFLNDQAYANPEGMAPFADASNPDLAVEFMDFMLRPEVQAEIAVRNVQFPATTTAELPEDFAQYAQEPPEAVTFGTTAQGSVSGWISDWERQFASNYDDGRGPRFRRRRGWCRRRKRDGRRAHPHAPPERRAIAMEPRNRRARGRPIGRLGIFSTRWRQSLSTASSSTAAGRDGCSSRLRSVRPGSPRGCSLANKWEPSSRASCRRTGGWASSASRLRRPSQPLPASPSACRLVSARS